MRARGLQHVHVVLGSLVVRAYVLRCDALPPSAAVRGPNCMGNYFSIMY